MVDKERILVYIRSMVLFLSLPDVWRTVSEQHIPIL